MATTPQPALYIPHGGGPCFFMEDPQGIWAGMESFLRAFPSTLAERPRALLVVSGHWETEGFAVTGAPAPGLVYDYYGFPPHTYALRYDVAGDAALAARTARLLREAGLKADVDPERGLDHGVFVPLMVAFPDADIPVVELSLDRSLDPALHLAAGAALAPLRQDGVLILCTGASFHNMRDFGSPRAAALSHDFDRWLVDTAQRPAAERAALLAHWDDAPAARFAHPREEHLLPLMVAAAAAQGPGQRIYAEDVLRTAQSGFRFDEPAHDNRKRDPRA